MTRLLDVVVRRFVGRGLEPSGASVLTQTYGAPGQEPILPTLMAQTQGAYASNAVVFGAILSRLMLFSEAEFKFRRLADKVLFGNQDLSKLERPWPNGTTGELLARMMQDVDLAGNAYVWDAGDQLVRLRPDRVTIISEIVDAPMGGQYRRVLGYWYQVPPGDTELDEDMLLPVEHVAHWSPIPDPLATFRGMSWLTPVIREVMADNAMTAYKIKYLENAASPNLLIKYSQKLGTPALDRIKAGVEARYGGVENAFKTLVLDEGADAMVIGNTFEQMNFSTVQAAGENRIVIASGVPGIVIGSKEGLQAATYSNYEQAMRRFADITMRPLWRSVCAAMAPLVQVPAGARLWFDTADIAALRQGEKERADTMLVKAQAVAQLVASFEPDSATAAIESGDLTQLKPKAPAPVPPALAAGAGAAATSAGGVLASSDDSGTPPTNLPSTNGTRP